MVARSGGTEIDAEVTNGAVIYAQPLVSCWRGACFVLPGVGDNRDNLSAVPSSDDLIFLGLISQKFASIPREWQLGCHGCHRQNSNPLFFPRKRRDNLDCREDAPARQIATGREVVTEGGCHRWQASRCGCLADFARQRDSFIAA